jgi:hypothetical protein
LMSHAFLAAQLKLFWVHLGLYTRPWAFPFPSCHFNRAIHAKVKQQRHFLYLVE